MIIRDALDADLPVIIDIYNATVPTRMVTAELEPTTVEARLPWFHEHAPWRKATAASSAGWTSRNFCRGVPTAAPPKSAFTLMKSSGAVASRVDY